MKNTKKTILKTKEMEHPISITLKIRGDNVQFRYRSLETASKALRELLLGKSSGFLGDEDSIRFIDMIEEISTNTPSLLLDVADIRQKKIVTDTIEGVILTPKRSDGNTTRQIDAAIQKIFDGLKVNVVCHSSNTYPDNSRLLYRIMNRLREEHGIREGKLLVDYKRCTIELCEKV